MRRSLLFLSTIFVFTLTTLAQTSTPKPKITFDEFFNSVSFDAVEVSRDGNSVVIGTEKADWDQQIFRRELWLYRSANGSRSSGSLTQLTQSGHDSSPQWSPDGQWIAFLSERKSSAKDADAQDEKKGASRKQGGEGKNDKDD